jgi:5-methylcytosine-specific restriction endonuclease McrA
MPINNNKHWHIVGLFLQPPNKQQNFAYLAKNCHNSVTFAPYKQARSPYNYAGHTHPKHTIL